LLLAMFGLAAGQYPITATPTPSPTATVSPATTTTPTIQTEVKGNKITRVEPQETSLPITGGDLAGLAIVGGVLIALGNALTLSSRRLKKSSGE
jgi:uncharacterized surface anchored protein